MTTTKPKRGRPFGSKDSKPRKRRDDIEDRTNRVSLHLTDEELARFESRQARLTANPKALAVLVRELALRGLGS